MLEFDERGDAKVTGHVHTGTVMVDGLGVGDVGNIVLRDRQHLAEDGIIIVVMAMDSATGTIAAGPEIVSRGFVYVKDSEDLMEEAKEIVSDKLVELEDAKVRDWSRIKTEVKSVLSDYVWKQTQRNPMILPVIQEV